MIKLFFNIPVAIILIGSLFGACAPQPTPATAPTPAVVLTPSPVILTPIPTVIPPTPPVLPKKPAVATPTPLPLTPAPAALPSSLSLATHAVGSLYNALGTGMAKLITDKSPIKVVVRPYAGPPAWVPAMDTGEMELGVLTSADSASAYKGVIIFREAYPNMRLLLAGGILSVGPWTKKDSDIRTVADLKGKRVPTGFAAIPVVALSNRAGLATAGLTWDDVVKVPVSDLAEGQRAFLEGRLDVFWHSTGSPAVEEANARTRGGIRLVPIGTAPEGAARIPEIYPGGFMSIVKAGTTTGVEVDTPAVSNQIYLVISSHMSDEAAYQVVKVLWESNEELGTLHAGLREWTRERMVSENASIPYHPGAIRFYKEKGVWSPAMETLQQKLLAR